METAPEQVKRLPVLSSGDEIFEGGAGRDGGAGEFRCGAAFYRCGEAGPVIAYFQRAEGFPGGFFEVGAPGGREPAEEKFVGKMDSETAGLIERERERGKPGHV